MREGAGNSGNSIRPWAAKRLTGASTEDLRRSLRQAQDRRHILRRSSDSPTKRLLLAREDWLIRCLTEELGAREAGSRPLRASPTPYQ